jgi:hypothetical protein
MFDEALMELWRGSNYRSARRIENDIRMDKGSLSHATVNKVLNGHLLTEPEQVKAVAKALAKAGGLTEDAVKAQVDSLLQLWRAARSEDREGPRARKSVSRVTSSPEVRPKLISANEFRKSSFCGAGSCIEVALVGMDTALLRDSKRNDAPMSFTRNEWDSFTDGVKAGEFDFVKAS